MSIRLVTGLCAAALLAAAPFATAHHSVAGQFDMTKPLEISGVVSKVEWVNPHIHVYLDVKDKSGKLEKWSLEGAPVGMMRKAGLSKSMLEGHGETVTILCFPARDGTKHSAFIVKISYPDGHVFQFSPDPAKGG